MPITNNAKTLLQQKRNNWQSVFGVRIASSLLLALLLFACKPVNHSNMVSPAAKGGAQSSAYGSMAENDFKGSPVPLKGGLTEKILLTAYSQIGRGYRFGGTSPNSGFDCSGFTRWVYAQNGINLPRSSHEQLQMGRPVAKADLRPGDLVIYKRYRRASSTHVGIYVGNGKYIHSPRAGYSIEVSDAFGSSTGPRFIGARRVFDDPRACPLTSEQASSARRLVASISKNDSDDDASGTLLSGSSSYEKGKKGKHDSKKSKKGSKGANVAKGSHSKQTSLASAEKAGKKGSSSSDSSKKATSAKPSKKSKSSGSFSEASPKKKKAKRS